MTDRRFGFNEHGILEWLAPVPNVTAGAPAWDQTHFRIRDDSTALNTSGGWLALEDTGATVSTDTTFRIRFCINELNNKIASFTPTLYVSKNSGGYAAVTGASSNVQAAASGQFADGDSCSSQLLSNGTVGAFENIGLADEVDGATGTVTLNTKGDWFECEFSLTIVGTDVTNGDTLDFRVYDNGSATDSYSVTPRVTVSATNNYTISGAVTVSSTVAATLDYTLNAAIAGAVTVPSTIASTMTYSAGGTEYTITGAVTVPITVGAYPADIWDEQFESTGYDETWTESTGGSNTTFDERFEGTGYEETWSQGETVTNGTLDEDYATSSVTGAPSSWGSQCLQVVSVAGEDTYVEQRFAADSVLVGASFEFIVEAEALNNSEYCLIAGIEDSGGNTVARFGIGKSSGGAFELFANIYHDGTLNSYSYDSNPISLDTLYKVELYWDITEAEWEWRVNDVQQDVGTITGSATAWEADRLQIGVPSSGDAAVTMYFDNVLWSTSGLPGVSSLDEDYATSNLTSPPAYWGDQCLEIVKADGQDSYIRGNIGTDEPIAYFRIDFLVEAMPPIDEAFVLFRMSDASLNNLSTVGIYTNTSGNHNFVLNLLHDGTNNFQYPSLTVGTYNTIEVYWNSTDDEAELYLNGTARYSLPTLTGSAAGWSLRNIDVGDFSTSSGARVYFDNVQIGASGFPGASVTEYSRHYTIAGDVTVGVAPGVVEPEVISDGFEGAGYEYGGWSVTTNGTGAIDPDAATSGVTGAPSDWETQCLACDYNASGDLARIGETFDPDLPRTYFGFDFIVESYSAVDGQWLGLADCYTDGYGTDLFHADLFYFNATGLNLRFAVLHDGTLNSWDVPISLDTRYRVEFYWDSTDDKWAYRLNGVVQQSGSLTSTAVGNSMGILVTGITGGSFSDAVVYFDNVALSESSYRSSFDAPTYVRNASLTGDVTVPSTVASTMTYSTGANDYTITGAVTVPTTVTATMAYAASHEIAGAVTVDVTPAATLAYNAHEALAGAVTVTVDPTASVLAYNQNEVLAGDVTVSVTVDAAEDYTRNASVAGDVTVDLTIAALMASSEGYAISGDVTVPSTVAATMAYNRNAALTGDVTVSSTIAAAMDHARHWLLAASVLLSVVPTADTAIGRELAGDISVPTTVAATLEYAAEHSLAGDIAVTVDPTASELVYNQNPSLTGDITVTLDPTATLDYTLNAELAGDITVDLTIAALMASSDGYAISGDVPVAVIVSAGMEEGRELAGAITVTITPASDTAHSRHYELTGATTVTVTPASLLSEGRAISGDVTVDVTPASTFAYAGENLLNGDVTVTVVPAAALDYTRNADLTGSVTVTVDPTAQLAYNQNVDLTGDITVPVVPAAATEIARAYELTGDTTVDLVVSSAMLEGRGLAGDVTVPLSISSGLSYSGADAINGDVTVSVVPAAALDYTLNAALAGTVTVTVTPAAGTSLGHEITGDVTVPVAVSAALEYTQGTDDYLIAGDVSVTLTAAAAFDYTLNAELAGDVTVDLTVSSGLSAGRELTGTVTVPLTVAASLMEFGAGVTGDITVPITVAADLEYQLRAVLDGLVVVSVVPQAGMDAEGAHRLDSFLTGFELDGSSLTGVTIAGSELTSVSLSDYV